MTKNTLKQLIRECIKESLNENMVDGQMKNLIVRLMDNGLLTLNSAKSVLARMEKVNEKFVATDNEDLWFQMEEILNTFLDSLKLTNDELDRITVGLLGMPTAREMLGIMQTIVEEIDYALKKKSLDRHLTKK